VRSRLRAVGSCIVAGALTGCSPSNRELPQVAADASSDGTAGREGGGGDAAVRADMGGAVSSSSLDVPTDNGVVHGAIAGGVRSFLGIPYAATTGGPNRWRPPQRAAAWATPLDATAFGPVCPQVGPPTMMYATTSDENCLSLNVWTPDPAPNTPLPVMVWIHGGGFVFGSSGAAPGSGNHLVPKGDVVVVSVNYRLGALGFLAHSALAAEDPSHYATGNYGLLDQQAALKWVQSNIAAFGGDKSKVTLFGESAGGKSVCLHLLSPGSRGLFAGAIVESGECTIGLHELTAAAAKGDRFAQAIGCTDPTTALSCLRAKSAKDITIGPANLAAPLPGGTSYHDDATSLVAQPIVDGVFLTDQPSTLFANNKQAPVPVLQGANTSEGVLFTLPPYIPVATDAEYLAALTRRFGASASAVAAQYPAVSPDAGADGGTGFPSLNDALTQVTADAFFVCPARKLARLLSAAGSKHFLYSFNGLLTNVPIPQLMGKAFHSAELPYVFGDAYDLGSVPAANQPLVDAVEGYWTQFARTGDPNAGSNPMWPAYTTAADQNLNLDTSITVGSGLEKDNCDFWESIPGPSP
jgi:para-nitrobenzyl esterase